MDDALTAAFPEATTAHVILTRQLLLAFAASQTWNTACLFRLLAFHPTCPGPRGTKRFYIDNMVPPKRLTATYSTLLPSHDPKNPYRAFQGRRANGSKDTHALRLFVTLTVTAEPALFAGGFREASVLWLSECFFQGHMRELLEADGLQP